MHERRYDVPQRNKALVIAQGRVVRAEGREHLGRGELEAAKRKTKRK